MTTARASSDGNGAGVAGSEHADGNGARVADGNGGRIADANTARVEGPEHAGGNAARVEGPEHAGGNGARVGDLELEPTGEVNGAGTRYAGLATRTIAFAADAAVINVVAWGVAAIITLGLSLIAVPDEVRTALVAIGAVLALLWSVGYFVFFWSASGQTPGDRVLGIRVEDALTGAPVRPRRALLRVIALPLSALPLCAGFLLILVDDRRRALHDRIARTTVSYALPSVAPRRVRRGAGARGRG
jgi:uncharacterized RDD family membrane protein YckC